MTYVCLSRWEQLKFPWGGHITLYMREKKSIKLSKNTQDVYKRESHFLF